MKLASPSTSSSMSSSSSSSTQTAALVQTTISGKATTVDVSIPTTTASDGKPTDFASSTDTASTSTSATSTPANAPLPASSNFPQCNDAKAAPFCLPENNTQVYIGETYYVTWNSEFFSSPNASITVILQAKNSSNTQTWSSDRIPNAMGYATVTMQKEWLGSDLVNTNNLTFVASEYDSDSDKKASFFDGPNVILMNKPAEHLPPPPPTKAPNKLGLMLGLPIGLGFTAFVVVGLCIGMRKHRQIGLGNIMSRNRGYVSRKSRRQRLGGKTGNIRLEDREVLPEQGYRDEDEIRPAPRQDFAYSQPNTSGNAHARDISLGSLVSEGDDRTEVRQQQSGNAFRQEIAKQKANGRR
jgi:hypothetical protein